MLRPPAATSPGTKDKPFATLERARDEIRKLKAAGPLRGGVTVEVRGGVYHLAKTLALTAEDGGTAEAPIVYRAYPNERPVLVGGLPIANFAPHQGEIVKADVGAQGFRGVYFRQLIFDGRRQHLSRYPTFDPKDPDHGGWAYVDGKPVPMYQNLPGDDKRTLHYAVGDARRWSRPEEGEVFIFARYNWWNNIVRISSLDRENRKIKLAADCSYAIRPTDRYYVRNLFEELDAPGEWYLDRQTWTLYFWPPAPLPSKAVYAPTLRTILDLGPGTAHVIFQGFVFECCEGTAITLRNTTGCSVAASLIRNVGDYNGNGVQIEGGTNNGVVGNDIHDAGRDALVLSGGDRITLTPCGNHAENNCIRNPGVYYRWGCGITLNGCGLRASRNTISDCPRAAIGFMGNNLVMEYNHMHHLCLDSEDAAGIGTGGRDWISSRGSVIRHNLIHDVPGYGRQNGNWVSPYFAWGIYLDDNTGGVDVIGNIVARCGRAGLHLHNARDTVVRNNIFVENGQQQIELSGWTGTHPFWTTHLPTMIKGYESVSGQPAWKKMRGMQIHPRDAVLPDGRVMSGNIMERNIFGYRADSSKYAWFLNYSIGHNTCDRNLVWHDGRPPAVELPSYEPGKKIPAALASTDPGQRWGEWQKLGLDVHSILADPLFMNAASDDYRLKPESPAFQLGFEAIPVERIGCYRDDLRASWPILEKEKTR
jgi:parallel beta-helix repeat protein